MIPYSQSFDNAAWTVNGASITSGFTSPDGTTNAFKLVEDTSTGVHRIYQTSTVTSSTNVSISTYVKYAGTRWVFIRNAENSVGRYFDLVDGVIGGTGGLGMPDNSLMVAMGDGWYKISVSNTNTSAARLELWMTKTEQATFSTPYIGDGTSGVYIYGAQLEQGSYATSLINTQGSAVTRVADVCTNGGNDQVINSTEGTLYYESTYTDGSDYNSISISNTSGTEKCRIWYDNTNLVFATYVGGVNQTFIGYPISKGITYKIGIRYKLNDFALFVDGVKATNIIVSLGGVSPANSYNHLSFTSGDIYSPFYGNVKDLKLYNTALTDAELIALTS